jgi:acetylornithine deacetylase/succinyl-diaminopimelate desuccinylase-like protein
MSTTVAALFWAPQWSAARSSVARSSAALLSAALFCAAASAMSCAAGAPATNLPAVPAVEVALDLIDEVVPLTVALIQTAPVNPPGGEGRVVRALVERLVKETGIVVDTAPFGAPEHDRANLLARVQGSDRRARPILLVGHSDVVPAERADWDKATPPFDGVVENGVLTGRGSLDMLGMVALSTLTLVALARAPEPPRATVMLLVVGDEETLGLGMQAALAAWPELETARVALNEGGFIVEDQAAPGHDAAAVSVAEKGFLHVELTATGPAGHGSMPRADDAPARISRAVERILEMPNPMRLTPETEKTFAALGHARGGLDALVLSSPALISVFARERIESDPQISTIVHDTCALTVLDAGEKTNVIPSSARAVFDCRLLPGTDPVLFFDELLVAVDDPRVTMRVLASSRANGSPADHVFLDVIRARLAREGRTTSLVPLLSRGFTDSRFLRARGVPSYGLVPFRVTKDELARMHGVHEQVRTDALEEGLVRLVEIVRATANLPDP